MHLINNRSSEKMTDDRGVYVTNLTDLVSYNATNRDGNGSSGKGSKKQPQKNNLMLSSSSLHREQQAELLRVAGGGTKKNRAESFSVAINV